MTMKGSSIIFIYRREQQYLQAGGEKRKREREGERERE